MLVRVERVLERTGKLAQTLRIADIQIDVENRTVLKRGTPVSLKPMEYELLVMLVRYKNRTLPRDRLLNEVWGTDFVGGTRTVDVHVAQLRKKLGLASEINPRKNDSATESNEKSECEIIFIVFTIKRQIVNTTIFHTSCSVKVKKLPASKTLTLEYTPMIVYV